MAIPDGPCRVKITKKDGSAVLFRFESFPAILRGVSYMRAYYLSEKHPAVTIASMSYPDIDDTHFYCPGTSNWKDDNEVCAVGWSEDEIHRAVAVVNAEYFRHIATSNFSWTREGE